MKGAAHNAIVLSKINEQRLQQLWGTFAKSEPNAMRISEYIQLVIDRGLITNQTTLKHFYDLFNIATEKRISQEAPQQTAIVLEKTITKAQFIFLVNQLGKYMFQGDRHHQDKMYNQLLKEKAIAERDQVYPARQMILDEINRKMMMENAVVTIINFEQELKALFLIYVEENYWSLKRQNRLLLTMREVELQNKKMSMVAFIRFLKEADIVPHLINVQHVEDILSRIAPPIGPAETEFYYKHFLVDSYSKDLENPDLKHDADPGLLFFEFLYSLGRIAVETSKEMDAAKKTYDNVLNKFFQQYMMIRNNQDLHHDKQFPDIQKTAVTKLKRYYQLVAIQNQTDEDNSGDEEGYDPFQDLKGKHLQLERLTPLQFNVPVMVKNLHSELPPLPAIKEVKQEQPPPYAKKFKEVPKVTIGQQPPPEKSDKKGGAKPPVKKKPQLKKGQKPPRVFQFQDKQEQTKKVLGSEDYLQKLATELDYSLKPLSSMERGSIPLDPFPSLISEILYPPEIPEEIIAYIEAAINAHNEGAFALAIRNYDQAYKSWRAQAEISPSIEMYFEFSKGGVYLSAGKDDYAFNSFYNCRNFAERINYLNPDRALPYCGLGQSLYNAEEYELACRCFLKAREIRESLLGLQSVDTVTVYNNLGCCFFMLQRSKQALSYFKICREVMVAQLGEFHERSQTSRQNVSLCNKAFFENSPEYRKLWQVFERDMFGKKKKKKKGDKKKK